MREEIVYATRNIHFLRTKTPRIIQESLGLLKGIKREKRIVDLGCGDGAILEVLLRTKVLPKDSLLIGIDSSAIRCQTAKRSIPDATFIVGSAEEVPLADGVCDLVISRMVIEHIPDDRKMLQEIYRILKTDKWLVISSVIRKRCGLYFYRRNGRFVLDPTHLREYGSRDEFLNLLQKEEFKIDKVLVTVTKRPLLDLFIRALLKLGFIRPTQNVRSIYVKHKFLSLLQTMLQIPIPGYYWIEVIAQKS